MTKTLQIISHSAEETIVLGQTLAGHLKPGDIVCLSGDLGAGKTTLIKGIAAGLDLNREAVSSPTFVLMNIYEGQYPLYHFDLYRLDDPSQLSGIGIDEFLYGEGIALIEWAEKLGMFMPKEFLKIEMVHLDDSRREIHLSAEGKAYESVVERFQS